MKTTRKPKPTYEARIKAFLEKVHRSRPLPERNTTERPRATVDAATWYTISRKVDFSKPCVLICSRILSQMTGLGMPEQPRTQKLCLEWNKPA